MPVPGNYLKLIPHKKLLVPTALILLVLAGVWLFYPDPPDPSPDPAAKELRGFAFFGVDRQTRFSSALAEKLENRLGDGVREKWGIADLEILHKGFLARHFPDLQALHHRLNAGVERRLEESTFRLSFRHIPARSGSLFEYAELLFSNYSQQPLMLKMEAGKAGADIPDILKQQYGRPQRFQWAAQPGRSLYWRDQGDILILSVYPDRFDQPQYQIALYFVDNLTALARQLSRERQEQQKARQKAMEDIFSR